MTAFLRDPDDPDLLRDTMLSTIAEALNDIERTRIANENRLRTMTFANLKRGGHALGAGHPAVDRMTGIVNDLRLTEQNASRDLEWLMRNHPLGEFVRDTPGLGYKQVARLLGCIGDPYWHDAENRPRSVRELWAYCGYHVIDGEAPKRRKGEKINWNPDAKMRVHLIADKCVQLDGVPDKKGRPRAFSPYRVVYDDDRKWYADAVHEKPCVRCGPSGKPAQIGSELSDGHKHARALRAVSKDFLKDLWRESQKYHERQEAKMAVA